MSSAERRRRAVQVRLSAPPTERLSELQRPGQWRRNTNCLQKEIFLNRAPAVRYASLSECEEGRGTVGHSASASAHGHPG